VSLSVARPRNAAVPLTPQNSPQGREEPETRRFDRAAVLGPQHVEVQRGHDRDQRRGRCLMATNLEAVAFLSQPR